MDFFNNLIDMDTFKSRFSWIYLTAMLFFVIFSLVLAISPLGKKRLGADDERPEFSTVSWFAMLFGAGMGIGLVFWGVAEPLSHYIQPMKGIEPQTKEAAAFAMRSSFMHWGLHPWACYAILGLGLAWFQFREKKTALVSNLFLPLWGEKHCTGLPGKIVDIFTTVITVVGVATSLGMGCLQICGGLHYLFGIPENAFVWLTVIVVISFLYLKSAISGIDKGIQLLSDINLYLFAALLILGFLVGPGREIVSLAGNGIRDYLVHFIPDSLRLSSQGDSSWINKWRVFYWAWWLSWAPFVGIFIARISKGRTIREFILGVILVPTFVSILWFSVFGGLSLHVAGEFTAEQLSAMVASPQTALFIIFDKYPFGKVLSFIALDLLITFFVTSANSATYVLAMLTSKGDLNPPGRRKLFWGLLIAVMGFLLILSGDITVIQDVSIMIAFPYLFILILICVSIWKKLKEPDNRDCGADE